MREGEPWQSEGVRRLLFFTTSLGGGGAESHTLRILNHIDRTKFRPMLALAKGGGRYEQFLASDVPVEIVGLDRLSSSTGRLLVASVGLRRLLARWRPDAVCSVMDLPNIVALLAQRGARPRPKSLACVQNSPVGQLTRSLGGRLTLRSMSHVYPTADRVIALSRGVGDELVELIPRLRGRVTVIHNACVDDRVLSAAEEGEGVPRTDRPVVLAVGRLTEQKGFRHLIDAFAQLPPRHGAELWLLGEGPLRTELEQHARQRGITGSVRFLGFRDNPQDFMRRATVFVLSSLWEGFGNVIVEALACGTPVVSTRCPHGPTEILTDQEDGLLVPVGQAGALASAIEKLLADDGLRARLRQAGLRRARDFSAKTIAAAYEREFERTLAD